MRIKRNISIQVRKPRSILFSHESIEPYVGLIGTFDDMEGGIAIGELALNVLAGPSLVADGRGLFLCIHAWLIAPDVSGGVEEIVIPQGTPLCAIQAVFPLIKSKRTRAWVFFSQKIHRMTLQYSITKS